MTAVPLWARKRLTKDEIASMSRDDLDRYFIMRGVRDNPGILFYDVSRDPNGRSVAHLVNELVQSGHLTENYERRLHVPERARRTRASR